MLIDQYQADFSQPGADGNSCLHFAAINGNQQLVKYFLNKGLSPITRNRQGKNVYDVAEGFGLKQMLMPLIFAEEERTGTAPVIEGATRDLKKDAERFKNLAPPPPVSIAGSMQPPPSQSTINTFSQQQPLYQPPPMLQQQQQQQQYQQPPAIQQPIQQQFQQPIQQQPQPLYQQPATLQGPYQSQQQPIQTSYQPPLAMQPPMQLAPAIQQPQPIQQQSFQQHIPQPSVTVRPPSTPVSQINYGARQPYSAPKIDQSQSAEKQAQPMGSTVTPPPPVTNHNPPRQIQFRPLQVYSQTPRQQNS